MLVTRATLVLLSAFVFSSSAVDSDKLFDNSALVPDLIRLLDTQCGPSVYVREDGYDDPQYIAESHELHLNFDAIYELPADEGFRCMDAVLEAEKYPIVDNVWFHVSYTSYHNDPKFLVFIEMWRKDPHYFVFVFSDDLWKQARHWHYGQHENCKIMEFITPIMWGTDSFGELKGRILNWTAFAIPKHEQTERGIHGYDFTWAIPYNRGSVIEWKQYLERQIQRHTRYSAELFIPFSFMRQTEQGERFIQSIRDNKEQFKAMPVFGSVHMKENMDVVEDMICRFTHALLEGRGQGAEIGSHVFFKFRSRLYGFSLSLPYDCVPTAPVPVDYGYSETMPTKEFMFYMMDDLFPFSDFRFIRAGRGEYYVPENKFRSTDCDACTSFKFNKRWDMRFS